MAIQRVAHLTATIFGITAWRVYSSVALVGMYVALKLHWARNAALGADSDTVNLPPGTDYVSGQARMANADVNLSDTQRIDLLHRRLTLNAREKADLKDISFDKFRHLSVTFLEIELASGREFAHIKVELDGGVADCGKSVQQIADNEFLVPRGVYLDPHCAVHFTCNKGDAVSFLEFKVPEFDIQKNQATIEVKHVRGRRAA